MIGGRSLRRGVVNGRLPGAIVNTSGLSLGYAQEAQLLRVLKNYAFYYN
jgi:hypothetical protein